MKSQISSVEIGMALLFAVCVLLALVLLAS
jgi:hypothetical protein